MAAQQERWAAAAVRALAGYGDRRDAALLAALLTDDVRVVVDSGTEVSERESTAHGRAAASALILKVLSLHPRAALVESPVNGMPGLVLSVGGAPVGVLSVGMTGEAISAVWIVLNPDKLRHFESF